MARQTIDDADQRADGRIEFVGDAAEAKRRPSYIHDAILVWI